MWKSPQTFKSKGKAQDIQDIISFQNEVKPLSYDYNYIITYLPSYQYNGKYGFI